VNDGRRGLLVALVGFLGGYVLSAIAVTAAEAITGDHPSSAVLPLPIEAPGLIGLWAGLAGCVVYWSRTYGTGSLARDFGLRIGAWWDVPLGAAVGLIAQYALIPLLYLPFEHVDRSISHRLGQPTTRETASAHGSTAAAIVVLVLLAVGAPFVEELYFRGLVLRSLLAQTPVPVALVADGLLFGLAHYQLLQFAGLAVFGVVLAVLAWRTGRLTASVSAHIAFNTAAVLSAVHLH
jgi:membrane protease YdiL (CAAX protease family)